MPPRLTIHIWHLKKDGLGVAEIGRRVGISKQSAHVAFKRVERALGEFHAGSVHLTPLARRAVLFLTDSENPSLSDLRRSMMWWNEKGGWAAHLLSQKGFGRTTVEEISRFCGENGIEEEIVAPPKQVPQEKRWERSEPPPDRERVSASHVLAVELSPRAVSALESFLGEYPTFEDLKEFMEGNRNWRKDLLKLRNCGKTTIQELEDFAGKNGINCKVF